MKYILLILFFFSACSKKQIMVESIKYHDTALVTGGFYKGCVGKAVDIYENNFVGQCGTLIKLLFIEKDDSCKGVHSAMVSVCKLEKL